MQRWEYLVGYVGVQTAEQWYWSDTRGGPYVDIPKIEAAGVGGTTRGTGNPVPVLNALGADGWEVVGVLARQPGTSYDYGLLLKRPVPADGGGDG